jgi:hypothetical protein
MRGYSVMRLFGVICANVEKQTEVEHSSTSQAAHRASRRKAAAQGRNRGRQVHGQGAIVARVACDKHQSDKPKAINQRL